MNDLLKNFYPTPEDLIRKMVSKIDGSPSKILEPSAGKGDIITYLNDNEYKYSRCNISAIEINEDMQATLKGKSITVIDSDFLSYNGPDQFFLGVQNNTLLYQLMYHHLLDQEE